MTLRARLTVALLALALIPTALYTAFTLDQLGRSAERWFRPGVNRALESALETTRTTLARVEAVSLAQADAFAAALPARPLADADRERLRAALHSSGLDFVQIYRRAAGRWRLTEQIAPPGVIALDQPDLGAEIGPSIEASRVIHSAKGAIAAVAALEGDGAIVAGAWVPPDFFSRVDDVGLGVSRYGQLGVLVKLQRQYVWFLVTLLVIGLSAIAVVLASSLARGMSRPLRDLAGGFERVAGGDLGVRIEPAGARELRTLGESFNTMTARLEAARDSLKQAEREAAWREVARRLAHEFKNILTPMGLSLHRMQRRAGQVAPEHRAAVADSLAAMDQALADLTRLAEQFSQYARLPEPRFERIDLAQVVRDAAQLHEPGRCTVTLVPPGGPLPVSGDRLLLSRAVHNLLLNACEASPDGGTVDVSSSREGDVAVVEVLDRGCGLAPEVRARLFEPYVSTKARGSGLGLSLVRDIAVQHGGTITLDDREGGGARARIRLPVAVGPDPGSPTA